MVSFMKIFYKSALSFIGLIAAGYGVQLFNDFLFHNIRKPIYLAFMNLTLFQYLPWVLLAVSYAYVLFLLFRKEKHMRLIMCLNGLAAFLQFYVRALLQVSNEDIGMLSVMLFNLIWFSVLISAFIFRSIAENKKTDKEIKTRSKAFNALLIFFKSSLCFILLGLISQGFSYLISNDSLVFRVFGFFTFMLESPYFILPPAAIFYAFLLNKLLKSYAYRRLIIMINAVFLVAVWILTTTQSIAPLDLGFNPFYIAIFCGNTGYALVVLEFIFASVKKRRVIAVKDLPVSENTSPAYPRPNL